VDAHAHHVTTIFIRHEHTRTSPQYNSMII
jgi:hypothetical protein